MANAQLKWSFEMRLLVDMLYDKSEPGPSLTPKQRSDAFNSIFREQIRAFGFLDGVPYLRLNAQYGEKKKTNKDWMRIKSSTPTKADVQKRRTMQAQLDSYLQSQAPSGQVKNRRLQTSVQIQTKTKSSKKRPATSYHGHDVSTPLSKRPAIGLWTPETPQDLSFPNVVTATTRKPMTSKKKPIANKPKSPKSSHVRRDGSTILVSNDIIIREFVPSISQHRSQPPLPKLLFRLWREGPSGRDNGKGFWSRRHHKKNALSSTPPRSSSIDATDILDHMNRTHVDTPFISTSNRLIWMMQQMVNAIKSHSSQWHVSVINVDALDKRGVFWARPFHDEVRLSKGFTNGAGNYRGTYEFLVWQKIPEAAILHTFKVRDLLDLASDREVSNILRFEVLHRHNSLTTKTAILRRHKVPLSRNAIDAIATLVSFFGIRSPYSPGHIAATVSGVCEGWGLDIQPHDEREWQNLANHFANRLDSFEPRERQDVKFAFLDGIAWGCGEPNAKHTNAGIRKKVMKASAVGLASPSDILLHELDALKLALKLHEKEEQRSLEKYHAIQPAAYITDDVTDDEHEAQHDPEREFMGAEDLNEGEEIVIDWTDDDAVSD